MTFDEIKCEFGDHIMLTTTSGKVIEGILSDIEWDFDGSLGGDWVTVKLDGPEYVSLNQDEVLDIVKKI